jgi:hypothetical protein
LCLAAMVSFADLDKHYVLSPLYPLSSSTVSILSVCYSPSRSHGTVRHLSRDVL